jgi:hypothetical protein
MERLKVLTRDGRSQAQVIEEALDRMPDPECNDLPAHEVVRRARIAVLIERLSRSGIRSMAEFDAEEYDENGLPR